MIRRNPEREPEAALAAAEGGAVTRDRLRGAASRDGRDGAPVVLSLLAQSLPTRRDLARLFSVPLRLDRSLLVPSPEACRYFDPETLREMRCVPLEIFSDLCVLAVEEGRAERAVATARHSLARDVLPIIVEREAIEALLRDLPAMQRAVRRLDEPRRDGQVHARFRTLVLESAVLDALSVRGKES